MINYLIDLIRIALGNLDKLQGVPSEEEWQMIFKEAQRQAIAPMLFPSLEKLPENQRPNEGIVLRWYSLTDRAVRRNLKFMSECQRLTELFKNHSFGSCILKGEGNALLYPNPLLREAGDIDIWLNGGRDKIIKCLDELGVDYNAGAFHHAQVFNISPVEVEVHYYPSDFFNPFSQRHFLVWTSTESSRQMNNFVATDVLEDGRSYTFPAPTPDFNVIYNLVHIFRHFCGNGIGLRQIVDYYYILKSNNGNNLNDELYTIKKLGMKKFAAAMMWLQKNVFLLEDKFLICSTDEKGGKILLDEILATGNFGKTDTRMGKSPDENYFHRVFRTMKLDRRRISIAGKEIIWRPLMTLRFRLKRG